MTKTILIADDNIQLLNILKDAALREGYITLLAEDGAVAIELFKQHTPQIVLLDVMMPKIDGFEVCKALRSISDVPIIMITARGEDYEKIMGLEIGADDYIVKPFSPSEVMARIKAILRRINRNETNDKNSLIIEDLCINLDDYSVTIDAIPIALTKREIDMLWTLVKGKHRAFTRDVLLDQLWGYDYYGDPRTVDSHMKRLRSKLDAIEHPLWNIITIRNVGYKFEVLNEK